MKPLTLKPGARKGTVTAPPSKSHRHRVLIADFLAGGNEYLKTDETDSADVLATKRSLKALTGGETEPVVNVGESGSTYRFLAPVAAALGKRPKYVTAGRLAERPQIRYETLKAGIHEIDGGVSSQFVSGLLFALPLLKDDSEVVIGGDLQSRGYVEMTEKVLGEYGIRVEVEKGRIRVPGNQRYERREAVPTEGDWSGAAFWFAMNAIGSRVEVLGLDENSAQPDRAVKRMLEQIGGDKSMEQCPDLFPALAAAAAGTETTTRFVGIRRLRMKESDRVAAMAEMLEKVGVRVDAYEDAFTVHGTSGKLGAAKLRTFGDHRIAMAAAVVATRADGNIEIDDSECVGKSYPDFFERLSALECEI